MGLETASWGASEASQIPITPRPQFTDTFRGSRFLQPHKFHIFFKYMLTHDICRDMIYISSDDITTVDYVISNLKE